MTSEGRKTSCVVIDKDKCKACHYCIAVCPREIIGTSKEINRLGFNYAEVKAEIESWIEFAKSSPMPDAAKATANVYVGWEAPN